MPSGESIGAPPPPSSRVSTIHFPLCVRSNLSSLDLAYGPTNSSLPLTPPPTPASIGPADSGTRSSHSKSVDITALSPYVDDFFPIYQRSTREHLFPEGTFSNSEHFTHESDAGDSSVLPSPTSPNQRRASLNNTKIRPEPKLDTQRASHFLFISGIPKAAKSQTLKQAFVACGDLKGIFIRFQIEHGAILLAFYDVRHTIRAHYQTNTRTFFGDVHLASCFISANETRKLIGQSDFVNTTEGDLFISMPFVSGGGEIDVVALQQVFASFGDLRSFELLDRDSKAFHVEYFDARDARSSLNALNDRIILGMRLHLTLRDSQADSDEETHIPCDTLAASASPPSSSTTNAPAIIPFLHKTSLPVLERRLSMDSSLHSNRHRELGVRHTISEPDLRIKGEQNKTEKIEELCTKMFPHHVRGRRRSNIYHFDSVGKMVPPIAPPHPRSISVSSETASPVVGSLVLPLYSDASSAPLAYLDLEPRLNEPQPVPHDHVHRSCSPEQYFMGPASSSGRNRFDIASIERGLDTRTTVMIKNVPNKMGSRHLLNFINNICPRKVDFLYLRMDFTNGCNVGYAFVNFIHVGDLLHFAKTKLGTKWNVLCSEKTLGMSYARYQGKQALINKFRSSSIMGQRESWRPKLFHSFGPKKGLPEAFPPPIQLRQTERSNLGPGRLNGQYIVPLSHTFECRTVEVNRRKSGRRP